MNGFVLHNELLFRKWVPVGKDGVKKGDFQMVVPSMFCVDISVFRKRTLTS